MTREKLLETAQKFYAIHKDCIINDIPVKEYLEIGLKALEQEPCDDVIRREAVEDIRRALLFQADNFMTAKDINRIFDRYLERVEQEIEPQPNTRH